MIEYKEFSMEFYNAVIALWAETPGIGLSSADEPERIAAYLARNPGMSFVALDGDRLVGALLAGHDGRRGFLHHLAVHPDYRHRGIASELVRRAEKALSKAGIDKAHLFIYENNHSGMAFWEAMGWQRRQEIGIMSKAIGKKP